VDASSDKIDLAALVKAMDYHPPYPKPFMLYLTKQQWKLFEDNGWNMAFCKLVKPMVGGH
jgi:hypothetical protein